jgi:CRP/FNR family transcriptional regulator, dissimilatory nitrate respiration regulator
MLDFELLKRCPLFLGLDISSLESLINAIHFQVKRFKKGEVLATTGERVRNLYIVIEGSVKGEMIDYSGKTIKIEDVEAPKPLASAFLFGKENQYPVTVTANDPVVILSIPIEEFLKILQKNVLVLTNYLNSISTRTQFLSQKISFLNFKTIKEKVAHFLLQKAGDRFHSIELHNTQQQLADLFGVARPSLARVLSEMQNEGLIEIERKTVKLINKAGLNSLLRSG